MAPGDVKYLALEGGGGKGNAFVGALTALEKLTIIEVDGSAHRLARPAGVAGASAGAIVAAFLASGYSPREIGAVMAVEDFERLFDRPEVGVLPPFRGISTPPGRARPDPVFEAVARLFAGSPRAGDVKTLLVDPLGRLAGPGAVAAPLPLVGAVTMVWTILGISARLPVAVRRLGENWVASTASAATDLGLFPGVAAWALIHKWITIARLRTQFRGRFNGWFGLRADHTPEQQIQRISGMWDLGTHDIPKDLDLRVGVTFEQHRDLFRTKLAVTGSELESMSSHLFSADTTPNFWVEDAVRLSMSLPLLFKPYVLRASDKRVHDASAGAAMSLHGVWVDGGLFNNAPQHVFDAEAGKNPKTLLLRLDIPERMPIDTLNDLFIQWPLRLGFLGSGETMVSQTLDNVDCTVVLDPRPFDLLDFSPTAFGQPALETVFRRSANSVLGYFREPPIETNALFK